MAATPRREDRDFFQLMTRVAAAYAKQEPDREKREIQRQENKNGTADRDGGGPGGSEKQSLEVMGIGRNSVGNPCKADTLNTERRGRSLSWPIRRNASWLALRGWIEQGDRGWKRGSGCFMARHLFDDRLVPIPLYPRR